MRYGNGNCVDCAKKYSRGRKEYNREYSKKRREDPVYREKERLYKTSQEGRYKTNLAQAKKRETIPGRARCLFQDAKTRALKYGIPFTITKAEVLDLLIRADHGMRELGLGFDYRNLRNGRHNAMVPSLDQIVPGLGYTLDNIRIVPWCYNAMKGDWFTDSQALDFCCRWAAAFGSKKEAA